jgi:hypothetical protein
VEVVLIIVICVILVALMSLSPSLRRMGEGAEHQMRGKGSGADIDRQFERPRDEGNLL